MINFHDKKSKRIIASVICILLVAAMIIPMVLGYLIY